MPKPVLTIYAHPDRVAALQQVLSLYSVLPITWGKDLDRVVGRRLVPQSLTAAEAERSRSLIGQIRTRNETQRDSGVDLARGAER